MVSDREDCAAAITFYRLKSPIDIMQHDVLLARREVAAVHETADEACSLAEAFRQDSEVVAGLEDQPVGSCLNDVTSELHEVAVRTEQDLLARLTQRLPKLGVAWDDDAPVHVRV